MKSPLLVFALCAVFLRLSTGGTPQVPVRFKLNAESPAAGAGAPTPERFHAIGTRAVITHFAQPQPGLYEIFTRGSTRFRVTASSQTPHGLWMADIEALREPEN